MIDAKYLPNDNSDTRSKKTALRIKIKVAVLDRWSQDGGPPKDVFCPAGISDFNKWEAEDLNMEVMLDGKKTAIKEVFKVSAVSTNKEANSELKTRAIKLMADLKTLSNPKGQRAVIKKLKAERDEARAALQRVTNEFTVMRYEIARREEDIVEKDENICNLTDRNAELIIRLNQKPTPIHSK